MVGFRVLDVGLLGAWLFWFFRRVLDDDGDDDTDDDDRRDGRFDPAPEPPPALPGAGPWPKRLREHGDRITRRRPGRVTDVTRERERVF